MRLNLAGRQWALEVYERLGFAEFNGITDDTFGLLTFPPGAFLKVDCQLVVEDAFVGPGTAELVVTNDATGAAIATVDLLAAATTLITVAGYYPTGIRIRFTVNKAGPVATVGSARLTTNYVIDRRANETQTDVRPL